jgi:hypothetical protein
MPRLAASTLFLVTLAVAMPAFAQEACKTTQLKNPALKLDEIYRIAEGHAKAWKADARPARLGNTSLGPLKADGSSEAWNLMFYSASANANVSVNTFRGSLTCYANPGSAGRMPDLAPTFLRDGAKLYGYAKQYGEALLGQGYIVMIQTAASPSTNHATWYVNFSKDNRDGGLSVIVDANTGNVEKVIK